MSFSGSWQAHISGLLTYGVRVSPRGMPTLEVPQHTIRVNTREPVLNIAERKLNYQFMAAEAYWILIGDDKVKTIEPYNKNIAQFSDDGETFYGAYGPRIKDQLQYVVDTLLRDEDTRQAGLTLWHRNPRVSHDIPCTIAIFFSIRQKQLNTHIYMRSSDVWLGLPYDVFTFSMLCHLVCSKINSTPHRERIITPGQLYLTAASSHLYSRDDHKVDECMKAGYPLQQQTPDILHLDPAMLMEVLKNLRSSSPGDEIRWWEKSP